MSFEISAACKRLEYTGAKRAILMEFADHANDDGVCWPSRARIMYNTGLSEKHVKDLVRELRNEKLIELVGYAELVDGGEPKRIHETGGRGRFPIYRVHPERGKKKPPFHEWRASLRSDGEGDKSTAEKGGNPRSLEYKEGISEGNKNATRSTARKNGTAPRQQEMERIAAALWEKGKLKLDGNEWGYNLKQLSHIYANDEITIDEMERLPEMAVEYIARWKKLDVRKALRAFRADEIELPPKRRKKGGAQKKPNRGESEYTNYDDLAINR